MYLYRYFNDNAVRPLLYVGITSDLTARDSAHRKAAAWYDDATRREVDTYPDRASASAAEREAIRSESPRHNKNHSAAYAALPITFDTGDVLAAIERAQSSVYREVESLRAAARAEVYGIWCATGQISPVVCREHALGEVLAILDVHRAGPNHHSSN